MPVTRDGTSPEEATLLDVLIDGLERNEVLAGFHWRELPMPDEGTGARRFAALVEEARRWKGPASREAQPMRPIFDWLEEERRPA